jgi:hypothetical protein
MQPDPLGAAPAFDAPLDRFIAACVVRDGVSVTRAATLHSAFCAWTRVHDEPGMSAVMFARSMEARGFYKGRSSVGVAFHGVSLRADER